MGKRVCVIDVEMTGLRLKDRMVSFCAWEIKSDTVTGNHVSVKVNPERFIAPRAEQIHGISNKEAAGFPLFAEVAPSVVKFIGDSDLVMHCPTKAHKGMATDEYYLNMELQRAGFSIIPQKRFINTYPMSRDLFGVASLNGLLDHYNGKRKQREEEGHGAKLDAKLLAKIYPRLRDDFEAKVRYRAGAFDSSKGSLEGPFVEFFRSQGMAP